MQVLLIKIEVNEKKAWELSIDNLSREDSNKAEKDVADQIEFLIGSIIKSLPNTESVETTYGEGSRNKQDE